MKKGGVKREDMDSSQFLDCWEFEEVIDLETCVTLKGGFVLKMAEARMGDWRFRPAAGILYIEYWNGSAWVEQGRYEA